MSLLWMHIEHAEREEYALVNDDAVTSLGFVGVDKSPTEDKLSLGNL